MSVENTSRLSRTSASFAYAAAICVVANTMIACAKDASPHLKAWMASLTGHDWTTQGIAMVSLFFLLGLVIRKTSLSETVAAGRVTTLLAGAAIVAGVSLFAWYALF